ncbi:MAG TPA: aldose epimerase [Myxococcales bacterium]
MMILRSGDSLAEVVPERGAICSRLRLGGSEVLHLDPATLADPSKNVRGGIPVLFPIAGKPPGDSALKQHGFARNLPWEPLQAGESRLECRLAAGGFEVLLVFTLEPDVLRLEATVHGEEPFQLGFHPYFLVRDKSKARVETKAARAYDNRTGADVALVQDFTRGELDLHIHDHRESGTVLHRPPDPPIILRWSPDFRTMVLWTLPEKPFICVEPWTPRWLHAPVSLSFEIGS